MTKKLILSLLFIIQVSCSLSSPEDDWIVSKQVSIPATLAEVKRLKESGSDLDIKIIPKKKAVGGGGSCHALPICLGILGAKIYKDLFPDRYTEVIFEKEGQKKFEGTYGDDGLLLQGREFEGKNFKDYSRLDFRVLEKKAVVFSAKGTLDEQGEINQSEAQSITDQINLIPLYQQAFDDNKKNTEKRTKLIDEAVLWLGVEAKPLVSSILSDPQEFSQVKAKAIESICDQQGWSMDLINQSLPQPGGLAAAQAILCWLKLSRSIDEIKSFVSPLVQGLCREELIFEGDTWGLILTTAKDQNLSSIQKIQERLVPYAVSNKEDEIALRRLLVDGFESCDNLAMKVVGRYYFTNQKNIPISDAEYFAVLDHVELGPWFLEKHSINDSKFRLAIFEYLEKQGRFSEDAVIKLGTDPEKELMETSEELERLAKIYSKNVQDKKYEETFPHLLYLFYRYQDDSERTQQARDFLNAQLKEVSGEKQVYIALALYVLGDKQMAWKVISGFKGYEHKYLRAQIKSSQDRKSLRNLPRLVFAGFLWGGCDREEVNQIKESSSDLEKLKNLNLKCLP